MANKQPVVALLSIALAIIHIVGGTTILRDVIENENYETQQNMEFLPTQEPPSTIDLEGVQEINEGDDLGKSVDSKKFVIVTTVAPSVIYKKKPFLGIFDKKFKIVTTTEAPETTDAPTIIYVKKPLIGIFDTETKDKIRAQFMAHKVALEQILADSELDNKVKIVFQTRNLNTGEEVDDVDLFDIEHQIEDEEDDYL